jgi:hypothetical protein
MTCKSKEKPSENSVEQFSQGKPSEVVNDDIKITKIINLQHGFKIEAGQEEDFKSFKTYMYLKLIKDNKTILVDSTREYEFGDKLYPIVMMTDTNAFELLFEVNDRPNKNYLNRIRIIDGEIIKEDQLPTFISKSKDINNDGVKEYAGFWDSSEHWGENYSLIAYNPILYYSVTPNGLLLDTILTQEKNILIYGEFHGFDFTEKIPMPLSVEKKFDKEIKVFESRE